MTRTAKLLLSGCLLVIVVGVCAAVLLWRFVASNKDAWIGQGREALEEGRRAGESTDDRGCFDDAMAQLKDDHSFGGGLRVRLWMGGCFETSARAEGFCANVPPPTAILKTVEWSTSVCLRQGMANDSDCTGALQAVQEHCAAIADGGPQAAG